MLLTCTTTTNATTTPSHKKNWSILLKHTTLMVSDYKYLSILPLSQRLEYTKGVLVQNDDYIRKSPTYTVIAQFSFSQSRHSSKINVPIPRLDLFKFILVYSGSVIWNLLPDSLRVLVSTTTFKSRYSIPYPLILLYHTLCNTWSVLLCLY